MLLADSATHPGVGCCSKCAERNSHTEALRHRGVHTPRLEGAGKIGIECGALTAACAWHDRGIGALP